MFTTSVAAVLRRSMQSGNFASTTACSLAGALLLSCLQAGATTIPYKNFNELIKESDAVVSGRVAKIESKFSSNKEDIYTFVTLDRVEALSGSYSAPTLTLRFLGGQVGNEILNVAGSPSFEANQHVVVFVHGNGKYMVPVVGWSQGVFKSVTDAAGNEVMSDNEGNRVFRLQGNMLVKEQTNKPEAEILGVPSLERAGSKNPDASAGSPDFIAPTTELGGITGVGGQAPVVSGPAMSRAAFFNAIRNANVTRNAAAMLRSVGPSEAESASDNTDGSVGPKLEIFTPGQAQTPVLPQPAPQQPAKDNLQ